MRRIRRAEAVRSVDRMTETIATHTPHGTASRVRAMVLAILGNILVVVVLALAAAAVLAGAALVFGPALLRMI